MSTQLTTRTKSLESVEDFQIRHPALCKLLLFDRRFSLVRHLGEMLDSSCLTPFAQFYIAHGKGVTLLHHFLAEELREASLTTLFRESTTAVTLFTAYFFSHAQLYIRRLILPTVSAICSSDRSWEINSTFIGEEEALQNLLDIQVLLSTFLNRLFDPNRVPPVEVTTLLNFLQQEVVGKFGEDANNVVLAFFFLRCICPPIVSPHRFGILSTPPSGTALRGLVLLTKMLQQLANRQIITEDKGSSLCQFNGLLLQAQEPLEAFSQRLVAGNEDRPAQNSNVTVNPISANALQDALQSIRSYIGSDLPSVLKVLRADPEHAEMVALLQEEYPNSESWLPADEMESEAFALSKVTRSVSQKSSSAMVKITPKATQEDEQSSLELAQVLILKELLKQENQRRNFIDQSLKNAQRRLQELREIEAKCNCS